MEKVVILLGFLLDFPAANGRNWIIILSPEAEVESEYFHLRDAAAEISDLTVTDPFVKKKGEELNDICLELKNSRIYQRINTSKFSENTSKFVEPSNLSLIPDDQKGLRKNIAYKSRRLNEFSERNDVQIPVFRCQTHEDKEYWITYGFSEHHLFLLQDAEDRRAVSFIGQTELIPTIDTEYPRGEVLDQFYYHKANPSIEALKPSEKFTPEIISSIQFRLCCVTHAARQSANADITLNYANTDPQSMSRNHHVKSHKESEWDLPNSQALGCIINPKNADDVEFYLHYSTQDPKAVFVLDPKIIRNKEQILNVNAYIRNIHLPVLSAFSKLGTFS